MKTHVSLLVSELDRSIDFYTRMFGASPVKVKSDYAKFDISEPPLNLTLNLSPVKSGGQLSHLGIEVPSTGEVDRIGKRWAQEGLVTLEESQTDCCYALQDKVWVTDPDGAHWEVFTVLANTEGTKEATKCCDINGSGETEETVAASCC